MNTLDLAARKVKLKKVSGTNGGEWQGPCPACAGEDRFHVWPSQNEGKGAYWCRGCGKTGDNIQFLRDFEGMSFRDSCAELNFDLPDRSADGSCRPDPQPQYTKPVFKPATHASPADLWQEKARKFITWATGNLAENDAALVWLTKRGISPLMAHNASLGWNAGEKENDSYRPRQSWGLPEILKENGKQKMLWIPRGLVIPYVIEGVIHRIRIRRPEGEPRYYVLPGSSMGTMLLEPSRRAFVVVESELDAITLASRQDLAGAVGLGSASTKPDAEAFTVLQNSLQILNALDYDAAGGKAMAWWSEQFKQCDRWPTPKGKDPGEAYQMGIDLKQWIKAGLPPALTINNRDVPPTRGISPIAAAVKSVHKAELITSLDYSPAIIELLTLLRNNPGVKIINTPERYTVLKNGKYVGGRINELVFKVPEVLKYISKHPAQEIDGSNLLNG